MTNTIPPPAALTFRVIAADGSVREEHLSLHVVKIGRVPSANLRIEDDTVSRMHAVVETRTAEDVNIIDLGSVLGTYVNGAKINKARLKSGDLIRLGNALIELTIKATAVGNPDPLQPPTSVISVGPSASSRSLTPSAANRLMFTWQEIVGQFPEPNQRVLIACQIQAGRGGAWEARTYDIKRSPTPDQGWLIDFGNGWVGGGMRTTWRDVLDWVSCLAARDVEMIDVSQESP